MTNHPLTLHEIEQIKVLRADGMTYHAISLEIGRDPKTVKKACLEPKTAQEINVIKQELADAYEGLSRRMIESISDEDIRKINAYQRTISSGICTDKMRLLRNESTENISMEMIHANIEERKKRRLELLQELTGESAETRPIEVGALENKTHNQKQNDEN